MVSIFPDAAYPPITAMKPWIRILMIVTGIMLMLILVTYTDPNSVKEFILEKSQPARNVL